VPRPLPRFNPVKRVKDAEQLARVMREVDVAQSDPRPVNAPAVSSPRRLRGVPVVGVPGAGGTSPGTDPVRALIAKDGQRRRR
jgi:hypothetical protein